MTGTAGRPPEWRYVRGQIQKRAKRLGLDDDARRDLQRRAVGKDSCADMTTAELRRVLTHMGGTGRGSAGARKNGGAGRRAANGGAASARKNDRPSARELDRKIVALWISGWHLGVVRDRSDDGLAEWLRRRFAIEVPAWPDFPAKARAVEGLKAWLAREAGVDWRAYVERGRNGKAREVDRPQARVIEAQWRILCRAGVMRIDSLAALGAYAARHAKLGQADSHLALDPEQTIELMRDLGAKIRRAQIEIVPEPAA